MQGSPNILLVDDDEIDRETVERAFRKRQLPNQILTAHDGTEALALLREGCGEGGIRRPYLILLDLNMPRMGGLELLGELRRDQILSDSVVFVLTTSDAGSDKRAAYEHHVAGYLVKSHLGSGFANLADMLDPYLRAVELPPDRRSTR